MIKCWGENQCLTLQKVHKAAFNFQITLPMNNSSASPSTCIHTFYEVVVNDLYINIIIICHISKPSCVQCLMSVYHMSTYAVYDFGDAGFYSVLMHSKSTAQGPPSREGLGCMVPTLFHWELEKLEENIFKRHRRPTKAVGPQPGRKNTQNDEPSIGHLLAFSQRCLLILKHDRLCQTVIPKIGHISSSTHCSRALLHPYQEVESISPWNWVG